MLEKIKPSDEIRAIEQDGMDESALESAQFVGLCFVMSDAAAEQLENAFFHGEINS